MLLDTCYYFSEWTCSFSMGTIKQTAKNPCKISKESEDIEAFGRLFLDISYHLEPVLFRYYLYKFIVGFFKEIKLG